MFLDLYISTLSCDLILLPKNNSLHSYYLQTYISIEKIVHSFLTNGVAVRSELSPRTHYIFNQQSSTACGWDLIWTLYHKRASPIGGFNTYLDAYITTIFYLPNKDLVEFWSMNITIHKNVEIYKAVVSHHLLIKKYLDFLMSCTTIIPLLSTNKVSFTIFVSTRRNHFIYKAYTITSITKFIKTTMPQPPWIRIFVLQLTPNVQLQ